MIFADYECCYGSDEMVSLTVEKAAHGIVGAPIADRRDLLSLLRTRICLSCAEPRTGTFTECPVCRRPYPKDP